MLHRFTAEEVKVMTLDGEPAVKIRCPGCGTWGVADDDQVNGRVSMECPRCSFHETHNLSSLAKELGYA